MPKLTTTDQLRKDLKKGPKSTQPYITSFIKETIDSLTNAAIFITKTNKLLQITDNSLNFFNKELSLLSMRIEKEIINSIKRLIKEAKKVNIPKKKIEKLKAYLNYIFIENDSNITLLDTLEGIRAIDKLLKSTGNFDVEIEKKRKIGESREKRNTFKTLIRDSQIVKYPNNPDTLRSGEKEKIQKMEFKSPRIVITRSIEKESTPIGRRLNIYSSKDHNINSFMSKTPNSGSLSKYYEKPASPVINSSSRFLESSRKLRYEDIGNSPNSITPGRKIIRRITLEDQGIKRYPMSAITKKNNVNFNELYQNNNLNNSKSPTFRIMNNSVDSIKKDIDNINTLFNFNQSNFDRGITKLDIEHTSYFLNEDMHGFFHQFNLQRIPVNLSIFLFLICFR